MLKSAAITASSGRIHPITSIESKIPFFLKEIASSKVATAKDLTPAFITYFEISTAP